MYLELIVGKMDVVSQGKSRVITHYRFCVFLPRSRTEIPELVVTAVNTRSFRNPERKYRIFTIIKKDIL